MPKLSRMRFSSIGHENARIDDLIVPLTDENGRAADSTLWLRNGGGKSSIGTLFFASLLPGRRHFLGAKADDKQRRLEDYVGAHDRAVVALEWELDGAGLDGEIRHFVTGVFYEWPNNSREEKKSPTATFFCTQVVPECSELTLDGLPLYIDPERRRRRVLRAFKERWGELRDSYPYAQPRTTESHSEWTALLREAQIDQDVFRYQTQMNRHEGGADELFQFKDHAAFIDLVLDMALDPEIADTAAQEILGFRDKLARHANVLIPEQKLVTGLLQRMKAIVTVAQERVQNTSRLGEVLTQITELRNYATERVAHLGAQMGDAEERADEASEQAERCRRGARAARLHDLALERWIAERALNAAVTAANDVAERHAQSEYDHVLWGAAARLATVRQHLDEAALHEEQIERFRIENAPLEANLHEAAREYAAALGYRIERLSGEDQELDEAERENRRQARARRESAGDLRVGAERAARAADRIRERLAARLQSLRQHRADGALRERETPEQGALRWEARVTELTDEEGRRKARSQEVEQATHDTREQRLQVNQDALTAEANAAGERDNIAVARRERSALEEDEHLLTWLGVDSIDFERAADDVPAALRRTAHDHDARAVRFSLEHSQHERATHYLGTHELLPPSTDVERVLEVLQGRVKSWSGWSYIAEASGGDHETARAMVRRAPGIAAGVIVADAEMEQAERLLDGRTLDLDAPVLVVTISTFAEPGDAPTGFVLGPTSAAHFDRKAGVTELLSRQQAMDALELQISEARTARQRIHQMADAVERHQRTYPRGWLDERMRVAEEADRRAADAREHMRVLDGDLARLAEQKQQVEERLRALTGERATAITNGRTLRRFMEDNPEPTAELEAAAQAAETSARAQQDEASELAEQAEAMEERASGHADRRIAISGEMRANKDERARVREVVGQDVPSVAGNTHALRIVYDQRREEFEGKLRESDSLGMLQQAERSAKEAERALQQFMNANAPKMERKGGQARPVLREEIEAALDTLDDPTEAAEREYAFSDERKSLFGLHGQAGLQRNRARDELEKVERRCTEAGGVPALMGHDVPESTDAAVALRAGQAELIERLDRDAIEYDTMASDARREMADCSAEGERMRGIMRGLDVFATANSDLLASATPTAITWSPPENDAEAQARIANIQEDLRACREQNRRLDERRSKAATIVQLWISDEQFALVKSTMIQGLRGWSETQFEVRGTELVGELERRLAIIEADIADIDRDRVGITARAVTAAMEAAKLVEALPRHSRLPDNIRNIGGSDYLQIKLGIPNDPAEQRVMMENLVQRMVSDGKVPRGVDFAKEALRHLARKLDVKILFPDPNVGKRWKSITDLSKLSGGERLTCATVLYCAITRMRAHKRGRAVTPTGILFLDNPIGKVSRRTFLDLQREVARAMGVQLIYMTAVNDYEALSALPNLIRFRNDRRDRKTGEALLEIESEPEVLELARLVRDDTRSSITDALEAPAGA